MLCALEAADDDTDHDHELLDTKANGDDNDDDDERIIETGHRKVETRRTLSSASCVLKRVAVFASTALFGHTTFQRSDIQSSHYGPRLLQFTAAVATRPAILHSWDASPTAGGEPLSLYIITATTTYLLPP